MKIKANKKEFAELVKACVRDSLCTNCVLAEFCGKEEIEIEDFIEIEEPAKASNGFNIRGE